MSGSAFGGELASRRTRPAASPFAGLRNRYAPHPLEVMPALFVVAAALVGATSGAPVGLFLLGVVSYGAALALVSLLIARLARLDSRLARLLAGVSITFVVYGSLTPMLALVAPRAIDAQLWAVERAWFGTTLPELLQPYVSDAWTAFFGLAYSIHVPLFFLPAILHWRDGRYGRAERILLTLAIEMYLGFVGYALFPAYGPVGVMHDLRPLGTNVATQVVADYGVALGTFPSLHAGVSFAVALDGWRTSWRRGVFFTVAMLLVWGSTIYLRYHWVPDLVAGAALAGFAYWLAARVQLRWPWRPLV